MLQRFCRFQRVVSRRQASALACRFNADSDSAADVHIVEPDLNFDEQLADQNGLARVLEQRGMAVPDLRQLALDYGSWKTFFCEYQKLKQEMTASQKAGGKGVVEGVYSKMKSLRADLQARNSVIEACLNLPNGLSAETPIGAVDEPLTDAPPRAAGEHMRLLRHHGCVRLKERPRRFFVSGRAVALVDALRDHFVSELQLADFELTAPTHLVRGAVLEGCGHTVGLQVAAGDGAAPPLYLVGRRLAALCALLCRKRVSYKCVPLLMLCAGTAYRGACHLRDSQEATLYDSPQFEAVTALLADASAEQAQKSLHVLVADVAAFFADVNVPVQQWRVASENLKPCEMLRVDFRAADGATLASASFLGDYASRRLRICVDDGDDSTAVKYLQLGVCEIDLFAMLAAFVEQQWSLDDDTFWPCLLSQPTA